MYPGRQYRNGNQDGYIYSVNLFAYTQTAPWSRIIYWIMFSALIMCGAIKVVLNQIKLEKGRNLVTSISVVLSILTILFLAMTREAYAITMAFLLLILKAMLLLKIARTDRG